MKAILHCSLFLGLLLLGGFPAAGAEEDAPKAAPAKLVPSPGELEIAVTAGDKVKSFDHPAKAISDISRAVARDKKAKEGEEPAFEAAITLNDQLFTFSDPEAALEACKALSAAMRELPKLKMGLGDLGEIPETAPQTPTPAPDATAKPMAPKNQAAATAEVRRRINVALQRQILGTGSGGVSIRYPSQAQMQQTINQEIEKARQEGLLPPNTNAGAGFAGGDPREAKKEAIVQTLAFAFGRADATGEAGEKPAEDKPAEEKPAADKSAAEKAPKAEEK